MSALNQIHIEVNVESMSVDIKSMSANVESMSKVM